MFFLFNFIFKLLGSVMIFSFGFAGVMSLFLHFKCTYDGLICFVQKKKLMDRFVVKFVTLSAGFLIIEIRTIRNVMLMLLSHCGINLYISFTFTSSPADDHVTSPSFIGLIQILGTPSRILSALKTLRQ